MADTIPQENQLELPDLSADLGGAQTNTELNIDPESGLPDLSMDPEIQKEVADNTHTEEFGLPESTTARVISDNTPGLEDFNTNSANFPSQLDITGDNTTNNEVIKLSDEMFHNDAVKNYQDIQDLTNVKLSNTLGDNFVRGNNIKDPNNEVADSVDNSWLTEYDATSAVGALGEDPKTTSLDDALGKESPLAAQLLDNTPPSPNDPEPTEQPAKKNADSWLKRISWYEVAPEKRKDFDEDLTALAAKFVITKFTDTQYGWDDFSNDFDVQAKSIYGDDYWKTFTASTAKEIAVDGAIYMGILALASTGVGTPLAFGALGAKNSALAARVYTGIRSAFLRSAILGVAGGGTQQILNKINGQEKSLEDEIITRAVGNLFGEGLVTGGRFAYTGAKSVIKQKGFNFSDLQNAISEEFSKTYQFPKHKKKKEAKPVVQALLDNGAGSPATSNVIDTVAKDIVDNGGNASSLSKNLTGVNDLDVNLLNPETMMSPDSPVGNAVIANTIVENQKSLGLEPHVSMQLDNNGQWVFRKDLFAPIDRSIPGKGLNAFVTFGGVFDSVSNKLPALSATLNDAELATIAFKKSAISKLKQATKGLKRDETTLLDEVLLRGDEMETVFDSAQLKTIMGDKYTPELETAYRSMREAITEFGEAADKAIVKDLMDKGFRNLEIDGNVELVLPIKKVDDLRTRVYKTQELNAYGKSSNVLKEEIVFTADIKPIKNAIEFRKGYVPVKYEDTVNLVSVNKKTGETKLVSKYRTPAAAKEAAQKLKTTPNELFNPEENVDLIVQLDQISLPGMARDSFLQLPDEVLETMYKNIENVLPEGTKLDKGSIKAWIELTSMRKLQKKAITGERGERIKTTDKALNITSAPRKNTWESIANYIDQVSVLQGKPYKLEITNQFESKYADVLRGKAWDSNIDVASFSSKAMQDKAREAKAYQKIVRTAFSGQSDNARILSARENARFNEIMTSPDEDMTYFRKVMQKMAPDLVKPDTASVGRKFSLTTSNLYVRYNFQQFTVNLAQPLMALGARGVRLDKSAKALAQTVKFADGFLKRTYGSRRSAEQEQLWDEIVTSGYLSRADQDRIFKVLDGSRSAKATEVLDNTLGFAFDATEALSKVLTYNLERNDLITAIKKGTALGLKGQKLTTADIGGKEFQQIVRQKALVFAIDNSKANFTPASVGGILPTTFYEKAPLGVAKAGYLIDRNVGQFMSTSFKIAQNTYFQIPAKQRAGAIAAGMVTFGWSAIPMMGDLFTAVDKTTTSLTTQTRPNPASNLVAESAQWLLDGGEEAIKFIPGIDDDQAKDIKKLAEDITVGRGLLAERAGVDLVTRMTLGKFLSSFANKSDPWDYLAAYSVAEKTIESGGNFVDFMYNLYGAHLAGEQAAANDLAGSRDTFLRGLPFPVLTQYMNKKIAEDWDTYGQGEVFDKQYFRGGKQVVPERSTGNFAVPTPVDKRTHLNLLLGSKKTETQKNFSNMEKSTQWKQFLDRELKDWDVKLRTNVLTEKQREDTKKDYAQWARDVSNNMIQDGVSPLTYTQAYKDINMTVTKAYNKLLVNKDPVLQPMTEEDKAQAIEDTKTLTQDIKEQATDLVK